MNDALQWDVLGNFGWTALYGELFNRANVRAKRYSGAKNHKKNAFSEKYFCEVVCELRVYLIYA